MEAGWKRSKCPVAEWIGLTTFIRRAIASEGVPTPERFLAARRVGHKGNVYSVDVSTFPVRKQATAFANSCVFHEPLYRPAANGFLSRALISGLRFEEASLRMSGVTSSACPSPRCVMPQKQPKKPSPASPTMASQ